MNKIVDTKHASPTLQPGVRVWDPIVRLTHWGIVLCVILNMGVLEEGEWPHQVAGYAATGLVVLRLVWGLVGSQHARFSDFWPTRPAINEQLLQIYRGQFVPHTGHSPLGALMMLTLWCFLLTLGATGWVQTLDAFSTAEWLEETHELFANGLLSLALMHALAALLMSRLEGVRLIKAMVTGVKERC